MSDWKETLLQWRGSSEIDAKRLVMKKPSSIEGVGGGVSTFAGVTARCRRRNCQDVGKYCKMLLSRFPQVLQEAGGGVKMPAGAGGHLGWWAGKVGPRPPLPSLALPMERAKANYVDP